MVFTHLFWFAIAFGVTSRRYLRFRSEVIDINMAVSSVMYVDNPNLKV